MRSSAAVSRVKVSAGGRGVVSHAGMGLLRESADLTGLSAQLTAVLADTYKGPWVHAPGAVLPDLAAAVADGADCIDGVGRLRGDRTHVFGADGLDDHRPLRPRLPRSRGRGPSTSPRAGTRPSIPPGGIREGPRSPRSATGCCTSRPASPEEPANYGYASTPPGGGPPASRPPGTAYATPSPDAQKPRPADPKDPNRPPESPLNPATQDNQTRLTR